MEDQNVFEYITTEKNNWKTARVPLTRAKDWNMSEHIERCYAVANAYYFTGVNDGIGINIPVQPLSISFRGI